jgi:hypothetical protein
MLNEFDYYETLRALKDNPSILNQLGDLPKSGMELERRLNAINYYFNGKDWVYDDSILVRKEMENDNA